MNRKKLDTPARCPVCNARLDGVDDVNGYHRGPRQGDFSVCAICDTILVFGVNAMLQATTTQLASMDNELRAELLKNRTYIKLIRQQNPIAFFNPREPEGWPKKEYWPKELHAIAAKTKPTTRF